MAITKKPKPSQNMDVDALINKGGSVAGQPMASIELSDKPVPVVLRLPPETASRIERVVKARAVRIPRHTWLLEAVMEKLEREGDI